MCVFDCNQEIARIVMIRNMLLKFDIINYS